MPHRYNLCSTVHPALSTWQNNSKLSDLYYRESDESWYALLVTNELKDVPGNPLWNSVIVSFSTFDVYNFMDYLDRTRLLLRFNYLDFYERIYRTPNYKECLPLVEAGEYTEGICKPSDINPAYSCDVSSGLIRSCKGNQIVTGCGPLTIGECTCPTVFDIYGVPKYLFPPNKPGCAHEDPRKDTCTVPPTAKSSATVTASTTLPVDNNVGTITTGMIVTGSGMPPDGVEVTTVINQQNLILASAITIDDNVDLVFYPLRIPFCPSGQVFRSDKCETQNICVETATLLNNESVKEDKVACESLKDPYYEDSETSFGPTSATKSQCEAVIKKSGDGPACTYKPHYCNLSCCVSVG